MDKKFLNLHLNNAIAAKGDPPTPAPDIPAGDALPPDLVRKLQELGDQFPDPDTDSGKGWWEHILQLLGWGLPIGVAIMWLIKFLMKKGWTVDRIIRLFRDWGTIPQSAACKEALGKLLLKLYQGIQEGGIGGALEGLTEIPEILAAIAANCTNMDGLIAALELWLLDQLVALGFTIEEAKAYIRRLAEWIAQGGNGRPPVLVLPSRPGADENCKPKSKEDIKEDLVRRFGQDILNGGWAAVVVAAIIGLIIALGLQIAACLATGGATCATAAATIALIISLFAQLGINVTEDEVKDMANYARGDCVNDAEPIMASKESSNVKRLKDALEKRRKASNKNKY